MEEAARRHALARAPLLHGAELDLLVRRVVARVQGLGPLEALLADPTVTEVMVNGDRGVWVERDGRLEQAELALDAATVLHLIERVVAPLGRRVDRSSPIVDARLPSGARVHAVVPPLAIDGPCLTIRRFATAAVPLAAFAAPPVVELLEAAVRSRANILVSGATSAGKTTLLNALAGAAAPGERIVTIEDAAELSLPGNHVVRLEARPPQRRRRRRGDGPRSRAGCAAHAARSPRRRRGPWTRGARHGHGHEHRPRRLALHLPRQRRARRAAEAGGHGAPGRRRASAPGRPRARPVGGRPRGARRTRSGWAPPRRRGGRGPATWSWRARADAGRHRRRRRRAVPAASLGRPSTRRRSGRDDGRDRGPRLGHGLRRGRGRGGGRSGPGRRPRRLAPGGRRPLVAPGASRLGVGRPGGRRARGPRASAAGRRGPACAGGGSRPACQGCSTTRHGLCGPEPAFARPSPTPGPPPLDRPPR